MTCLKFIEGETLNEYFIGCITTFMEDLSPAEMPRVVAHGSAPWKDAQAHATKLLTCHVNIIEWTGEVFGNQGSENEFQKYTCIYIYIYHDLLFFISVFKYIAINFQTCYTETVRRYQVFEHSQTTDHLGRALRAGNTSQKFAEQNQRFPQTISV